MWQPGLLRFELRELVTGFFNHWASCVDKKMRRGGESEFSTLFRKKVQEDQEEEAIHSVGAASVAVPSQLGWKTWPLNSNAGYFFGEQHC